jgi:hypothetical protein
MGDIISPRRKQLGLDLLLGQAAIQAARPPRSIDLHNHFVVPGASNFKKIVPPSSPEH